MSFEDSPPYTSSTPAPSYSREPGADEERLAFSVRTQRRTLPTGQFSKSTRRITLTLHEQHCKAKTPVYEHHSLITGTIGLEDCDRVRSVAVNVRCYHSFAHMTDRPLTNDLLCSSSVTSSWSWKGPSEKDSTSFPKHVHCGKKGSTELAPIHTTSPCRSYPSTIREGGPCHFLLRTIYGFLAASPLGARIP